MAEPIRKIERLPEDPADSRIREAWLEKLSEHHDALDEALRLMKALHDRGILSTLVGFIEQSDRIARVAVEEVAQPKHVNAIGSLIALYQIAGKLNPAFLQHLGQEVGSVWGDACAAGDTETRSTSCSRRRNIGILGLWRQMRDPDVNQGLQVVMDLLRSVGRADRTTSKVRVRNDC